MEGPMLLLTARRLTRWLRDQGLSPGYLWVVDALQGAQSDRMARGSGFGRGKTQAPLHEGVPDWSRTLEAAFVQVARETGVGSIAPVQAALVGPECPPPEPQCWADGPRAGVYVSASRYSAHAVGSRYAQVIRDHHVSADERILGGLLEDAVMPTARQTWLARLWERPAGMLVVVELVLSQWERVQSALVLHEACVLAQEYGHRVIAHVRSPEPEVSLTAEGLERSLALPEYFDFSFIRSALRGTVTPAGEFLEGLPGSPSATSGPCAPGQDARDRGREPSGRSAGGRRSPDPVSPDIRRVKEGGQYRLGPRVPIRPGRTRAWREAQLARAVGAVGPVSLPITLPGKGAAEGVPQVPKPIRGLLRATPAKGAAGLVLVGGRPGQPERRELLKTLLIWTGDGEAALVMPAYRFGAVKGYLTLQEEGGIERVRSRAFSHLPMYSCFEAAYAAGHRRMMVECDCSPYSAATVDFVREHLDEICVIACVDEVDVERAFLRMTAGDWGTIDRLIGIVSWVHTPYGAFTDAFLSANRLVPSMRFDSASQAVRGARRLQWESLAVALLDRGTLPARQLQWVLRDCGFLSGRDMELLGRSGDPVKLKLFLMEKILNRVSELDLQRLATEGRFGPRRIEISVRNERARSQIQVARDGKSV